MTQDHIVPKSTLPPGILQPYWFRALNIVPACSPCNNTKGCLRSDCECGQCSWAWGTAKGIFGITERGYVKIVRSPG